MVVKKSVVKSNRMMLVMVGDVFFFFLALISEC